ncbi:MAG: PHP domain-containing protein [Mycobacteriales bacterium]
MRIDLHTHSTASDGTLSPAELMRAAATARLDVIALTDHDTTRGWDEAAEALPAGLSLVRGAELSCRHSAAGGATSAATAPDDNGDGISLHLLAFLFDPAEPALAEQRRRVREGRLLRGRTMLDRLTAAGFDLSWDEVLQDARGGTVGRPHLARALVRGGYVSDVDTAFGPQWLATRGPYWSAKYEIGAAAAIGLVRAAGGVSVLAHPRAGKRGRTLTDADIADLAAAGLTGLEVEHEDHSPDERRQLVGLADDLGLITTGSSDFHGTNKSTQLGSWLTEPAAYDAITAAATGCAVITG